MKNRINREPGLVEKYDQWYQSDLELLQTKIKNLGGEDFASYSNAKLADTIAEIFDLIQKTNPFSNCLFLASQVLEKDLRERWKDRSPVETGEFMPVLAQPLRAREYDNFKHAIKKVLDQNPELKNINEQKISPAEREILGKLAREFYWLTSFSVEPRSPESFIEDLKNFKEETPVSDVILPDSISDAEKKFFQLTAYVKDQQSTYIIPWYWFTLKDLWDEIIKRVGFDSVEDFWMSTHVELIEFLREDKEVDPQDLATRKEAMIIVLENGKLTFGYGNEAKRMMESTRLESTQHKETKEIKGQVAYPGNVKGTARIVLNKGQFAGFSKGEILVAPYTAPDYVPLMKKAAAIVTDLGGITSHAAIVSRELKVPCVIGTKIATQILKDGDKVEVDAERGIVRIIT